ncbi:MAG: hypothetical protein CSA73_00790 [Rhodobacterales bacterium]|nr:MAG: hypothetical protein CSA73_00790 [Rhodobacterales bacterium]
MRTFAKPAKIAEARQRVAEAITLIRQVQDNETNVTEQLERVDRDLAQWENDIRAQLAEEIRVIGCDIRCDFIIDVCQTCGADSPEIWAACPNNAGSKVP